MNTKYIGVLAILCASVLWAIEPVFVKLSYQNSDFLHTSAIRAIIVTIIALAYAAITNRANFRINKKQFSTLAYVAVAGTLFADLMYYFALSQVPVINAVVIGHLQPVFIILIGFLVLKTDRLTKFDYTGIGFMIISGLLVTTKTPANFAMFKLGTYGDLFVLSATIAWATTGIAVRKYLRGMNAGVVTFYRFLLASIAFVIYLISTSGISIANIYQVLLGIIAGAGYILYYESLNRIKAAQVGALELSTPFFAAILGFLVLGELVTLMQIIGILLLFVGIYYLSKKEELS
jgi:drug/metabolite transporter (DMT)-like permease